MQTQKTRMAIAKLFAFHENAKRRREAVKFRIQAEAYLEPSRTSTMELFCENSERFKAVNYIRKKAPS